MEQEALIRRNLWLDRREAEMLFGVFAEEFMDAVGPRLEPMTLAKYRSFLDNHLLPQWSSWPLAGIFNSYVEVEKWLSKLHEAYADSSVASIFSLFSTILGAAVKARKIPANPCARIRVTSGEFEIENLVATPVQALRAAMRLCESGLGLAGFALGLLDFYTGARWGELVGQQRHEYDSEARAIQIREPPEVARRARLGQKMKGIARVYDHVTPLMRRQILQALETRWTRSPPVSGPSWGSGSRTCTPPSVAGAVGDGPEGHRLSSPLND